MTFYLCDDDSDCLEFYAEKITQLCRQQKMPCQIICYQDGHQMLNDFQRQKGFPGVLLLDINMEPVNGIQLAQQLQQMHCLGEIVFLTVSKKHFLYAFDVRAFNYIVKDETSDERFEKVFLNAVTAVMERNQEYMLFTSGGEHLSVPVNDLYYFEVTKRIITVHYKGNRSFNFFSSLEKLENQLFGRGFVRIHRSYLIAVNQIERLNYEKLTLKDGTEFPIGRKYYNDIKLVLSKIAQPIL